MKALRYNQDNYVIKGYFERDIFNKLLEVGVKYKGYSRFYIPKQLKEQLSGIVQLEYVDDVVDWIHYGYSQEEAIKKSIFAVKDLNGSYIYIIDPNQNIAGIKKIKEIPYFYINLSKIRQFKTKLHRRLYIEDYLNNTDLKIKNPQLSALLYSQNNGFYIHNIVNRVGLDMYSHHTG